MTIEARKITELMFCEECHKFLDTWPRKDKSFLIFSERTGKDTYVYFHFEKCYHAYYNNPAHAAEIRKWY